MEGKGNIFNGYIIYNSIQLNDIYIEWLCTKTLLKHHIHMGRGERDGHEILKQN